MVYGRGGGFYLCGCLSTAHTPYWKHTKTKAHNIIVSKTKRKMIQQEIIDATRGNGSRRP